MYNIIMDCAKTIDCDLDFLKQMVIEQQNAINYCKMMLTTTTDPLIATICNKIIRELKNIAMRMIHMIHGRVDQIRMNQDEVNQNMIGKNIGWTRPKTCPCYPDMNKDVIYTDTVAEYYTCNETNAECPAKMCSMSDTTKYISWKNDKEFLCQMIEEYKRMIQLIKMKMKIMRNVVVYSLCYEILPSFLTQYDQMIAYRDRYFHVKSSLLAKDQKPNLILCDTLISHL